MQPYSLHLGGVLLTFVLKVTAAFLLCLCLTRVLRNPRHRFLTWLGLLVAAGVSWIALVVDEVVSVVFRGAVGASLTGAAANVSGEHVTVPASWNIWIARAAVVLTATYVVGATSLLAIHVFKHFRLRAWLKHGRPPSPALERTFQSLCGDFNIRRCRVLILPHVSSPATVYWWSPRVLLPEICEELVGSPRLGNILKHELIHTLRCDYLWATLGDLLCALLFFHPVVWHARKQLMMERELACDLGVIETHPEQRADYAETLAGFVRLAMLRRRAALGVDFAASPSLLTTRIHNILAEPAKLPRWKELVGDAAFVLFVMLFVSVSPALSVSLDFGVQASPSRRDALVNSGSRAVETRGLHRRHNRIGGKYSETLTGTPMANWVDEGASIGSGEPEEQTDAVAPSNPGPTDIDAPMPTVPLSSSSEMPIGGIDSLPGNSGSQQPKHTR
jgi:D-alanyl-D-alanine endopeptidase (penicillin-binding protein 7)